MNKNFDLKKIRDNIYLIRELNNTESCNIYLFAHNENALIFDAGLGEYSLKDYTNTLGLKKYTLVLTHSHLDHFGGAARFNKNEIFIPIIISQNILNKKNWGLEFFKKEISENIIFPGAIEISNIINWFNYSFEIINLGGHTNDSCIYYDKKNKLLISGDLLYDGKIFDQCYSSNKQKFIEALIYINHLDFNLVLTGHNNVMNKQEAKIVINKWLNDILTNSSPSLLDKN
ncbi:MAG: MBL fold metallo-hydrolase [Patescibacteria group bacterium]